MGENIADTGCAEIAQISASKTPRAPTPLASSGPGLFVGTRVRPSLRRVCRVAFSHLGPHSDRPTAKILWIALLQITRNYWADRDYDTQDSFGDIKVDLRKLRSVVSGMLEAVSELPATARRELNADRMFVHGDRHYTDYVGKMEAAVRELIAASDRISAPKYPKVKSIAVPRCASALAAVWAEAKNQKFSRSKRFDRGLTGNEFTSPGAQFVQLAMHAIDETVGFEQVHSWLAGKSQAQGGKK